MEAVKILIVEDEAIIARDLQRRLENHGYTVVAAVATGEDAILKTAETLPDLVLMDIVLLGDMDGIEAAGRIRSLYGTPIIYVTAYADDRILERAKITEPFGYILKPFDDRELKSIIEMALYKFSIESRLRQSNAFLNNVIESLSHPFYVINADDYRVVMANSAAKFGELNGSATCYALTHRVDIPCEGEAHPCTIREIRKHGQPVILEHKHFDANGRERTFEIHGYPIFGEEGRVSQVIEYTHDITDKRLLESQFRQAQKMESIGRLAGGIAHDFNNLLSAILGFGEIALSNLPADHPVRRDVNIIVDAGNKAATLVRQLLALSRKQVLDVKTVNLNDIVENMQKILRLVVGEDFVLELNLNPGARTVKADSGQLEQVLMNLAVNARDAMPCGGRLTVETDNVELDEQYAKKHPEITPGPYVMLAVTDTGMGMGRDVLEKIFEPFRGTGLGLSTVYGIVKQHNGSIYVYSEEGIGTTFKVYLPATVDAGGEAEGLPEKLPEVRGTESILIVDDEPLIRRLIVDTLEPLGYRVSEASCGGEALQRCSMINDDIALLLTDVVMPDMNGHELAEKIIRRNPGVKVVYMSGYTDDRLAGKGIKDTSRRFLQKPLTPRKLSTYLREVLDEE